MQGRCDKVVRFGTGEGIGDWLGIPNGGGLVVLRALWIAVLSYSLYLALSHIDHSTGNIAENLKVFATLFGVSYAAFYTRFASQWAYLSGLYNQIMQTDCALPATQDAQNCMILWKAAFIGYAIELHLARKGIFKNVIRHWYRDDAIQHAFNRDAQPHAVDCLRKILAE